MMQYTRKEKEDIYRSEMTKLQNKWGNPINEDWDVFFATMSDEDLDNGIKMTKGQLKYEKYAPWVKYSFVTIIGIGIYYLLSLFIHN